MKHYRGSPGGQVGLGGNSAAARAVLTLDCTLCDQYFAPSIIDRERRFFLPFAQRYGFAITGDAAAGLPEIIDSSSGAAAAGLAIYHHRLLPEARTKASP